MGRVLSAPIVRVGLTLSPSTNYNCDALKIFILYRLETSVTDEQLRKQVVTEEVVQAELEAQRRLMDVEHSRKMAAIREEMENEVTD